MIGETSVKGNAPEGVLLSKFFRWAKFPHPPIVCKKKLQIPAPDKLLNTVKEKIISPLVRVVCCYDEDHKVDHARDPRPDKSEVPMRYPDQDFTKEGKKILDQKPCQDFSHCAAVEPLYYALFGLKGKRQL